MKILISRKDLRNTTSGVPRIVLDELRYFNQLGHQAYAIAETINGQMVRENQGIPVKTWRYPFSGYWRRKFYQWRVASWIKKNRPDLVIGHGDILHQDILYLHNCTHLAYEQIEKKPLPASDEVGRIHHEILTQGTFKLLVCNSVMMKEDLVRRFKLDASRVVVIYPEVNLSKFSVTSAKVIKKEWRQKLGIPQEAFVFGMVTSGNFKKRNLELLIRAFKKLHHIHPETYLFVGGGKVEDHYQEMITERVTFAPTLIDVKNYYYLLDAYVLPAHIEEFGISVLEAMYCQIPVITSAQVGASEIFEGVGRELILETMGDDELVEKMERLLEREYYLRVQQTNAATAQKFNANSQNKKLEKVLADFSIL